MLDRGDVDAFICVSMSPCTTPPCDENYVLCYEVVYGRKQQGKIKRLLRERGFISKEKEMHQPQLQ